MENIISTIKKTWSKPASTPKTTEPFRLVCTINERDKAYEDLFYGKLPQELISWYSKVKSAILFEDVDYGQWGLRLFSFEEINEKNEYIRTWKEGLLENDLVIGEFLGDLDLLVVSTNKDNFGDIIIAIPIYERKDWYFLKMNFEDFLAKYIEFEGEKFWEATNKEQ